MIQGFFKDFKVGEGYDNPAAASQALTEKCGYAAAALTMIPIPGTEIYAVMPIHVGMVVGIGNIYGVEVTRDSAEELILRIGATVGLSLIGSRFATTAAKFLLPGLGGLVSAPFMYASTLAIGTVAKVYFEQGGQVSNDEMKSVYNESLKAARKSYNPKKAKSQDAKKMANAAADESDGGTKKVTKRSAPDPDRRGEPLSPKGSDEDPVTRLEKLKQLLDKGLIEQHEYEENKNRILADL